MNKVQHVKWCMKQTKLTSKISCSTDSCLAQLVRHWPEDLEVLVSIPTGGNFWRIFFCSSLYKDLSDNLTETPIVKNSTDTPVLDFWWGVPWVSKPGWIPRLCASSPAWNGCSRTYDDNVIVFLVFHLQVTLIFQANIWPRIHADVRKLAKYI